MRKTRPRSRERELIVFIPILCRLQIGRKIGLIDPPRLCQCALNNYRLAPVGLAEWLAMYCSMVSLVTRPLVVQK